MLSIVQSVLIAWTLEKLAITIEGRSCRQISRWSGNHRRAAHCVSFFSFPKDQKRRLLCSMLHRFRIRGASSWSKRWHNSSKRQPAGPSARRRSSTIGTSPSLYWSDTRIESPRVSPCYQFEHPKALGFAVIPNFVLCRQKYQSDILLILQSHCSFSIPGDVVRDDFIEMVKETGMRLG